MLKKLFLLSVLLAVGFTQSLYTDCYIQEKNLYSLADGETTYDNYSNVLYIQNEEYTTEGPELANDTSVSFFFQTDQEITQKTSLFSYNDNVNSPLLQIFIDGQNIFISTGQKYRKETFTVNTNTWYNILISINNSYIDVYIDYKYTNQYAMEFERKAQNNLTYSFGEDNFSGYLYETKLIQNEVLSQFNIMCIYSNQCNPRLRPKDVTYGWFNNQCKNIECKQQNDLLNTPTNFLGNQTSVFDQKTGQLEVFIQLNEALVTPECLSFAYTQLQSQKNSYTYIQNYGTFNNIKFVQNIKDLQNNGQTYVSNQGQTQQIYLNYKIQLSFVGDSHLTFVVPIYVTTQNIQAKAKLQANGESYNRIDKSQYLSIDTEIKTYNGTLKLMTDDSFMYQLPPFYSYPQNYKGKFYVQWEFQQNALPKNLYLYRAYIEDKDNYIQQVLNQIKETTQDDYRNYVLQTSSPMKLGNGDYYIVLIYRYRSLQTGFLQSTQEEDYQMKVPIKVLDDQIISL